MNDRSSSSGGKKTKSTSKTKSSGNLDSSTESSKSVKKPATSAARSIESAISTKEIGKSGRYSTKSIIISGTTRVDQKKSIRDVFKPFKSPSKPISKFRVQESVSNMMHEKLGGRGIERHEAVMTIVYRAIMTVFSLGGAAIFMGIDGRLPVITVTFCDLLLKSMNDVCGNITSICNGTLGIETDATTTSTIGTTSDNRTNSTNISNTTIFDNTTDDPDQWFDCADTFGLDGRVPKSFIGGIVFVLTIMTTIGYGHIAVKGESVEVAMVFYSLFIISLFFEFLNKLAMTVCDQIARLYDRLIRKRCMKEGVSEPGWMKLCPDLVPFSFLFLIVATYTIVVSAVFYATMDFTDFGHTVYFVFISVALIGLGDVVPCEKCQLPAMIFIIFGIIMLALITCVQEQWLHHSVVRLVEVMIGTRRQRFADLTLDSMMMPSEGRAKMEEVLKRMATGEETPYLVVELDDPYREVAFAKESARKSVHTRRQFTVSRFNVKGEDDSL